jgi:hypothetical protein
MMSLDSRNAPSLDLPARFMVLAIVSFAVAVGISPWALPLMQGGFNTFPLLAFVHLVTLGFIGAMIIGASYQLVPVALQAPLRSVRLGRASFWIYLAGLVLFLTGLLREWLPGLSIGGTLLGIGFTLYIAIVLGTLLRAPYRDAVGWHIAIGAVFSGVGMTYGVLLAFNKGSGFLGGQLLDVLAAHIVVMLSGWVAITFIGVAYRLIGMFTLAEKHLQPRPMWAGLVLVAGGTALLSLALLAPWPWIVAQGAAAMILAGFVVFAAQVRRMYRRRMRRTFDIHMPFAIAANTMMILSAASLTVGLVLGMTPADPLPMATGWLAIFGVALTAIQGFFYKISTFLVWLKRYAPLAGRQSVPKLEEMYSKRVALAGFWTWLTAIVGGWLMLILGLDWLPLIGLALIAGASCFVVNVVTIARHWFAPAEAPASSVVRRPGTKGGMTQ